MKPLLLLCLAIAGTGCAPLHFSPLPGYRGPVDKIDREHEALLGLNPDGSPLWLGGPGTVRADYHVFIRRRGTPPEPRHVPGGRVFRARVVAHLVRLAPRDSVR